MGIARKTALSTSMVCVMASLALAQPEGPAKVMVAPVVKRDIIKAEAKVGEGRTFVGTIWPTKLSKVGSAASGRVETIFAREGQRVGKGDKLAQLRTGIIQAQVDAAKATLKLRQAELKEMEAGNRKEEIAQAEAREETAKTQVDFTQQKLRRARNLGIGSGVSREELEEAISAADQAEAQLREARAYLRLMNAGFREERIEQAKAKVEEQEAVVRQLSEEMERYTIFAPFDGYVLPGHAEEGQWMTPGALVAEVAALDEVDVRVEVLEDYINLIRVGSPAEITFPALLNGHAFPGRVVAIVPVGDEQARTFPVKVRIRNELDKERGVLKLKGGMFARATFWTGSSEVKMMVPKDALVLGGPSPMVYVVEMNKAKAVAVEIGESVGGHIVVRGPLKLGQSVVVQGNERLRPGQDVIAVSLQ